MTQEKKRFLSTTIATLCMGLLANLFGMVNVLPSNDAINYVTGLGSGTTSGRWALDILRFGWGKVWDLWNLSYFNNMIALILLALSAYMIVLIFNIEDTKLCMAFGAVFITVPSVSATLLYSHVALYYSMAVLLTVVSVYLSEKYRLGWIASVLLASFAMGIYQAYFPLMIGLYFTLLLIKAIRKNYKFLDLLKQGFIYLGILLLTLSLYYLFLKIFLNLSGLELNTYQGIDNMGKLTPSEIPAMITQTYKNFMTLYHGDLTNTSLAYNVIRISGFLSIGLLIFVILQNWKKFILSQKGMVFLLVLLYPLALNSINIMCFHSAIHSLMVYGMVLIAILPPLLLESVKAIVKDGKQLQIYHVIQKVVLVLFIILAMNYAMQANAMYSAQYAVKKQAESYVTSMITRVQSVEGFTTDYQWIVVGEFDEQGIENPWPINYYFTGSQTTYLKSGLWRSMIKYGLGYELPFADDETTNEMAQNEIVQSMPNYPTDGSIRVIDDFVVIKLSEPEEP